MDVWINSLIAVLAVSLVSFAGLFTLSLGEVRLKRAMFFIVSLSVGALLGDVFIHLLPEVFKSSLAPVSVSLAILAGIISFFILEKFLHWQHSHGKFEEGSEAVLHDHRPKPLGAMILVADGLHNFRS